MVQSMIKGAGVVGICFYPTIIGNEIVYKSHKGVGGKPLRLRCFLNTAN